MNTRGFTLVQLLAILAALVLLVGILTPVFTRHSEERRSPCQSNLKQIMLGMIAYVQDYDEHLPLSRGNGIKGDSGYGWAGSSQSYFKSLAVLHCPTTQSRQQTDTANPQYTDYYYNYRLSGLGEDKLTYVSNTVQAADGSDGVDIADAAYSKPRLPPNWIADTSKPTYRHLGGANYAFADGHIKWLKPTLVTTAAASASVFTFAVK